METEKQIIINDDRRKFTTITFSNYKKCNVIKNLIQSIYLKKIEESFFWTCELLCTNCFIELWNTYFMIMSKYIHISNPKLPIFMYKKFKDFKNIAMETTDDFQLRNNKDIRQIFCSITLILSLSEKITILDDLNYKFNFQIENLYENLKAPSVEYINYIFKNGDPKEYIIPFNELIYHLKESKSKIDINFWINWIINYDCICRKKKKIILCQQRDFFACNNKNSSQNIIWIVWDILLKYSKNLTKNTRIIIENLFNLFTIKYSISFNKKRIFLIYHCVELILLDKQINHNIELLVHKEELKNLNNNISIIFEQIKKNEKKEIEEKEKKVDKNVTNSSKKMIIFEEIYNKL
tara:strand:- start:20 stop:1072 length:1053 start_codon:yes stop_codon:yes gene_type:complete